MPASTTNITDKESISTVARKRRMDWDPLDINTNSNGGPSDSKISNVTNGNKDRERRKTATSSNNGEFLIVFSI